MLQRLEAADGRAELAAGAQVFQGGVARAIHGAHGFRAQRKKAAAGGALQQRVALARRAQQGVRTQLHLVEDQFRRAAAVDQAVAARAQTECAGATRNRLMPASSSSAPAVRADTRYRSACSPAFTTALAPSSTQPPALRSARVRTMFSS
ncbi:hypothetical protein D3C85_950320 [compost metagenome]